MTINLSAIGSWFWTIIGVVILFIIFRFFFHIVIRIVHFAMSFFWHGCVTAIVLLLIYFILRALHIL
jgi:hypothetical protein